MIAGTVTNEDVPIVQLAVAGQTWSAIIDTRFKFRFGSAASGRLLSG